MVWDFALTIRDIIAQQFLPVSFFFYNNSNNVLNYYIDYTRLVEIIWINIFSRILILRNFVFFKQTPENKILIVNFDIQKFK